MSRSVSYRRTCSDNVSWRQDQALNSTIYILRNMGPTGFLLKEDGETKKFKVYLGDPHHCTCQVYTKEKDLCKHICWVLLKKFRIPRQNPVTWQLGLVEREVNEILRGAAAKVENNRPSATAKQLARKLGVASGDDNTEETDDGTIPQREISSDDVCPICQDELLEKHLPVTYCRYGCGNNVHIKCMKVWAEHQRTMSGEQNIKCPFCRENFGPFSLLQQEFRNASQTRAEKFNEHLGVTCNKCNTCPVVGKCYRCTTCMNYNLCQTCFNTPTHMEHAFEFKTKPNQRWRPAPQRGDTHILPQAVVQNLMNRDISEEDYDLLLQLDSQSSQAVSDLTEETIRSFPMERVRNNSTLLSPGMQCRVCLRAYKEGEFVRRLPCRHKFHKDCIDNWLLHHHATCPIDGTVYTNESVKVMREAQKRANISQRSLHQKREQESQQAERRGSRLHGGIFGTGAMVVQNNAIALEIPGIGIARRPSSGPISGQSAEAQNGTARSHPNNSGRSGYSSASGLNITGMRGVEDSTDGVLAEMQRHNNPEFPLAYISQRRSGLRSLQNSRQNSGVSAAPNNIQFDMENPSQRRASEMAGTIYSSIRRRAERSASRNVPEPGQSGLVVGNPNAEEHRADSGGRRRESQNSAGERTGDVLPREPVAPSIPQRGVEATLSVGTEPGENASRKPPSGTNDPAGTGARQGRLRTKPLYRDPGSRRRSGSGARERSNSALRNQSAAHPSDNLFVGLDPSSTAGFISEFTTNSGAQGVNRKGKAKRAAGDVRHRWGNTQAPSDEITLTGNALNGLSFNDILSP